MQEDQAIAQIREVRRQISEECDHDARKLVSYYKKLQSRHKERLLHLEEVKDAVGDDLVKA